MASAVEFDWMLENLVVAHFQLNFVWIKNVAVAFFFNSEFWNLKIKMKKRIYQTRDQLKCMRKKSTFHLVSFGLKSKKKTLLIYHPVIAWR